MSDWAIGAGFIRTLVWDTISHKKSTPLDDVDVLLFDPSDLSKTAEQKFERQLIKMRSDIPWSVKNQARMHIRNETKAALNTKDAMRYWLETPTAVAARIDTKDQITILAPFGLDDLFKMVIRPTPVAHTKMEQIAARLALKDWR
ncbi:MAG: nucleotidyltransferase family protein [Sneathiella sp.]|nr:nucleotidyltransferase family protein [Sneathiella sp.]